MTDLGVYIHIPFCLRKCNYCDFCSYAGRGRPDFEEYLGALRRHIGSYRGRLDGHIAKSVYFGGGTPTLLEPGDFASLLDAVASVVRISPDAEISTECNPATADAAKLRGIRQAGVDRISIGAQSFVDDELSALGRLHNADDVRRAVSDARDAGFMNVSLDLMYGIPRQTPESLAYTLDAALGCSPEHISAYCLRVEDGTPFGKMGKSLVLPDDDAVYDMYCTIVGKLGDAGYRRYEISNFARAGFESRHNLRYWQGGEYLGFGAAAYSYFGGERFSAPGELSRFVPGEFLDEESREVIGDADAETELVMLSMRLARGLRRNELEAKFGAAAVEKYRRRMARFVESRYIEEDADGWRFTTPGFFVSNSILSEILDFGNDEKRQ